MSRSAPTSFAELVELVRRRNEGLLYGHLTTSVHLVRFEAGNIELRLSEHAPTDLPQHLSRFLAEGHGRSLAGHGVARGWRADAA